jgi:maltose alpha-D-glucosyltransferase/alpha-amylase
LHRAGLILHTKLNAKRTRIHGDYHLGQVLYTGKDFVLVDLDGQPQRSLVDRRRKRSPLRDVVGLLRSFHYAVHQALHAGSVRPQDVAVLEPWARFWYEWASVSFLRAYLEVAAQDSFVPASPQELQVVLDFYYLKRLVNEIRQELLDSPERLVVPLRAMGQLLGVAGG